MINRRKVVSDNILNLNAVQKFLNRCLGTKSSPRFLRKSNAGKRGEEEGKIHLFKSRGQHLLTNPRVLDSIVRTSNIKPDDTILEIGPGTGNLTLKLLESAKSVVAVEIDNRMVEILRKRAAEKGFLDSLTIINGDALKTEFPEFNLVVANIPYGISSPLLAKLVYGANTVNPFRSATLLLQKEFARRLLAKPGDSEFNRLAVNMKLVADVEFVMDVSKRDFVPCPKVDSSVVKIYPKREIPDVDLHEWCAFTRTCFSKKNRTLGATFKQKRKLMELMELYRGGDFTNFRSNSIEDDEEIISWFRRKIVSILECSEFLDKRPMKLHNDDLLQLLGKLNEGGIYFHDHKKHKDSSVCSDIDSCDDVLRNCGTGLY